MTPSQRADARREIRARVVMGLALVLALVGLSAGCEGAGEERQRVRAERAESALALAVTCADVATLLATTAGSPDDIRCPNPRHVIEASPISAGTEEVGAVVVCRCPRGAAADGGTVSR